MKPEEFVDTRYEVRDGVATITMDRPEYLNALKSTGYEELRWAIRAARVDPSVDVVVLTGAGGAFAPGGDLHETLGYLESDDPLAMCEFYDRLPWKDFFECPKVIIAAVNGICMGGGLIGALTCDIVLAAESATFAAAEARVGVADALAPAVLFGKVNTLKAKYLLFTGQTISAAEAERYGLVTEVVPDDRLAQRCVEVIAEVRQTSQAARAVFKFHLQQLLAAPTDHGAIEVLAGPEALEGVRAFAQKRTPAFALRNGQQGA
jgi:enoyl-CoA hydratase/carnithine racemase